MEEHVHILEVGPETIMRFYKLEPWQLQPTDSNSIKIAANLHKLVMKADLEPFVS